jgi:LacI family transcriptional regulator
MEKTITLQDIADELGVSRNTVSKAFNGKHLPEKTKEVILNKAVEMGYKNLDIISKKDTILKNKRILILTTKDLHQLNFFIDVIRGIEDLVNKYNLFLLQYCCTSFDKFQELKDYIINNQIDGIICLEVFNPDFINKLLELKINTVFIDSSVDYASLQGDFDVILMENTNSVKNLLLELIKKNKFTKLGFVGDYNHCKGFNERFIGFKEALFATDLNYNKEYNITRSDDFPYGNLEAMCNEIRNMHTLPNCFVCANDFIAISLINTLNYLGIRVPQDIQVIGFDNTYEARFSNPSLTTINTDKERLGKEALIALLNRIKFNDSKNKFIYLKTNPIIRESTKGLT